MASGSTFLSPLFPGAFLGFFQLQFLFLCLFFASSSSSYPHTLAVLSFFFFLHLLCLLCCSLVSQHYPTLLNCRSVIDLQSLEPVQYKRQASIERAQITAILSILRQIPPPPAPRSCVSPRLFFPHYASRPASRPSSPITPISSPPTNRPQTMDCSH